MKTIVFFFVLCTSTCLTALGANGKRILAITPFTPESSWFTSAMPAVDSLASSRDDIEVKNLTIEQWDYADKAGFEELVGKSRDRFQGERPDLVLLFSPGNYPAIYLLDEIWPQIPIIVIGELDYICEYSYIFEPYADKNAKRTKLSELQDTYNITHLQTPVYVKETIDLMKQFTPNLRKVLYIGGEELTSKELQLQFQQEAKDRNLEFMPYLAPDHPRIDLEYLLMQTDLTRTGIIYTNWLDRKTLVKTYTSSSGKGVRDMLEDMVPHICPYYENTNVDDALAFVSYDVVAYNKILINMIHKVIDRQIPPRNIPHEIIDIQKPVVNYKTLQKFNIDERLIPANAIVANTFNADCERQKRFNQTYILLSICISSALIITFLTFLYFHNKRCRKLLKAEKLKAEASDRSKTAFVQNMSHEIRIPLNAIIGFSQVLSLPEGSNTEEEKKQYISYINNNSNMLMMLIDDILNLAEGETGTYQLNITDTSCNQICQSAMISVEYRVPSTVKLKFTSEVDDNYTIKTDGRRVQQIIINFLSNACKHTYVGTIHVHCSLSENPGKVTFSVADTGTGVPSEMAEDIFERFSKLDVLVQGTGLGLNICRTIAERLGGKVQLDKSYTQGARFVFII